MKIEVTCKKRSAVVFIFILTMATTTGSSAQAPRHDDVLNTTESSGRSNGSGYFMTAVENFDRRSSDESNSALPAYSLKKCYEIALQKNVVIKEEQNNIKAGITDRKIAQNSLLPLVSYNMGHYFSFGKNIDPVTNAFSYDSFSGGYAALGLQVEIFSGFKKINSIKQGTFRIKSAEYGEKKAELELLTNITLTYARLSLDKEELNNHRRIIDNTLTELGIINEKIKVGRLTKYEFYAFNARLNSEQADLLTLQNDSLNTLQDLKNLMNISYKEKFNIVSLDEATLQEICAVQFSADGLVASALANHPAIKQALMAEQAARVQVKIAKGNFFPLLFIGGNVVSNYNTDQRNTNGGKIPLPAQLDNNLGKNINIGLSIPIFSQMENVNKVRKEKINVSNAQLEIENAKNSVTTDVVHLLNDFTVAKEKYKATLSAFEQNNLSYDLYLEKYRLGQLNSMELITAQDILNTSASQYIESRLQLYFRFQLLELLKRYSVE